MVTRKNNPKRKQHVVTRTVKHAAVPHKANAYRPHLVRPHGIAAVVAVVALLHAVMLSQAGDPNKQTVLGAEANVTTQRLLDDTNQQRKSRGLEALTLNTKLDAAATLKANDMLADQYWSHVAPDGATPWQWIKETDYDYQFAGENLGRGFRTSSGAVTAWMASPEHRDNILNPDYSQVGFSVVNGVLEGERTNVIVALYGSPRVGDESLQPTVLAATNSSIGPLTRVGIGLQSMNPALVGSIVLLLSVTIIALFAHAARHKLPVGVRRSWRRHHGAYTALGTACLAVVLIALYGGGQI